MQSPQFVADRIRFAAKRRGFTLKEVLKSVGLNINAVSDLAKGQIMSYVSLTRIAEYLGVSLDYLVGLSENLDGGLSDEDKLLLNAYRLLSDTDKGKIAERIAILSEKGGGENG